MLSLPPPPTDDEVGVVLVRIAARVLRLLKRRGLDPSGADLFPADPVVEESHALASISSASIQGRIAFGPRASARVARGDDPDAPWVLCRDLFRPAVAQDSVPAP